MFRCNMPAGKYKVDLMIAHEPNPQYTVAIGGHQAKFTDDGQLVEAAPFVIPGVTWEGELCEHEVGWLDGLPGHAYPAKYIFNVEKMEQ